MTDAMTTLDRLRPVLAELETVMAGIPAEAADHPTPCTEMDVAALRAHVVQWLTAFSLGYADDEGAAPPIDGIEVSADTAPDQVHEAAGRLAAAIESGAAERPLSLGGAEMPGDMALSMILWEYQTHGWDLARATGQDWTPADDGVEASLAFAPAMLTDDFQGEGKAFAPRVEVADDAPALDRLLGLSGRDPHWHA